MNPKAILFFLLLFIQKNICYGQHDFHNYTKYEVTDVPKTNIEVNLPLDSAIAYFEESEKDNLKKISNNSYRLFNDYQAFITEESYKKADKNIPPYKWLYTHEGSLSSLWNVTFTEIKDNKTKIEFLMTAVLTENSTKAYINYDGIDLIITQDEIWKRFFQGKKLVSRGIIENLNETFFRAKSLPDLIAITINEKKGFDNGSYQYNDFIPNYKITPDIQFIKNVPEQGDSISRKKILAYERNQSVISLIDLATGKIVWKKQLENTDNQNFNKFNIYKNTIYVATSCGYIYALSLKSGEIFWRCSPRKLNNEKNVTHFFKQDLPISDDYIYANYNGEVYKVNRYNGKIDWSQSIGGYGHYNYSFDKNYLYKTGILECFVINKKDGKVVKIINNTQQNQFYEPHILDVEKNVIYLSGYAFDLTKDKILWNTKKSFNTITADNSYLYTEDNLELFSIDKNTGKEIWIFNELKKLSPDASHVNEIYNLKDEILLDVQTENYQQKTKGKALVLVNKKDGSLSLINHFTDEIISNPIISQDKIYLLASDKIKSIDISRNEIIDIKTDLSFLIPNQEKNLDYDIYAIIIE